MKIFRSTRDNRLLATLGFTLISASVLIGLLLWQGSSRPENSTAIRGPIRMQQTAAVTPRQEITLQSPDGEMTVHVFTHAKIPKGYLSVVVREPDLFPQPRRGHAYNKPWMITLEYRDEKGHPIQSPLKDSEMQVCFSLSKAEIEAYYQAPADFELKYALVGTNPPEWQELTTHLSLEKSEICADYPIENNQFFPLIITGKIYNDINGS